MRWNEKCVWFIEKDIPRAIHTGMIQQLGRIQGHILTWHNNITACEVCVRPGKKSLVKETISMRPRRITAAFVLSPYLIPSVKPAPKATTFYTQVTSVTQLHDTSYTNTDQWRPGHLLLGSSYHTCIWRHAFLLNTSYFLMVFMPQCNYGVNHRKTGC